MTREIVRLRRSFSRLCVGCQSFAYTAITRGADPCSPDKRHRVELSSRADAWVYGTTGRPQYDIFAEGIVVTTIPPSTSLLKPAGGHPSSGPSLSLHRTHVLRAQVALTTLAIASRKSRRLLLSLEPGQHICVRIYENSAFPGEGHALKFKLQVRITHCYRNPSRSFLIPSFN